MILRFPELGGGTFQGLNDAGVENFQGAIDTYLARECGQNTGDAHVAANQPARLDFDRFDLKPREIPCFDELRTALVSCRLQFSSKPKEREFFRAAVEMASQDTIPVLKISDYGTTGLTGDDVDESGRWFALVKSQGISIKDAAAGGSFGIGKSSPFAASRFRTVFYGTRTTEGGVAFQGVSRLVTHRNGAGHLTQGVGFIGDFDPRGGQGADPVFRAVRSPQEIPEPFRRNDPGTDIWVIGYRSGDTWKDDLIRSIIADFWPAIHRGAIEFRVGEQQVAKSNLEDLIRMHIGQEDFEAHHFFAAIGNQPIKARLNHVGECELYLATGSVELPKRICMARTSGMRIYDYAPKACRVPFSGLFLCTDQRGNKLLRQLEPPRHDAWDPKRYEGPLGKRALDEIKLWIREEVKKLNPLFSAKSFNETELAKYLPDSPPDDSDINADPGGGKEDEESLEPRLSAEPVRPMPAVPLRTQPMGETAGGVGPDGEGGIPPRGGRNASPTGRRQGGGTEPDESVPRLRVRSFRRADGDYDLVLRSEEEFRGGIAVEAVGEDGTRAPVAIRKAWLAAPADGDLQIADNVVRGVTVPKGQPLRLTLSVAELGRRSLSVEPRP